MADTNWWVCTNCGFKNAPHALRQGDEKNKSCEQCGADRDKDGEDYSGR